MKKFVRMILLTFLCFTIVIPNISGLAVDVRRVEVWKRTDIVLISEKSYANPYLDVQISAVFTHEGGETITLFGFWNGGNEWRIRFSPTKIGRWNYTVTCTDTANRWLNNVSGEVQAVANTGETDLDKHGFVRISDNGRHYAYDDGTPFYWLGDTNWQAPNYVSLNMCNYPDCTCGNQFTHEVDDRINKGFNVYQTYFDSGENDGGGQRSTTSETSMWTTKYTMINPETFTEKFDVMFDYLAEKGMTIALGFGVHHITTNGMGEKALLDITRYLTARYASYPVTWITAQEININDSAFPIWKKSAEIVDAGDGYNHPQGTHLLPTYADDAKIADLDRQEWHEWWALQTGHGPIIRDKNFYKGYWDNTRSGKVKPYLETEANYEDITCGGFNGYDASRISAWKANLLGSYGFTYGVTGIWANNYSTAGNMGWYESYNFEPWYMGLDKPGSYEMSYLRAFFEYADFSSLIPRFNDANYSNLTDEQRVVASSDNGSIYAAYFYNQNLSTGELRGLGNDTYSAKWYNPLTGKYIKISDNISVENGVYTVPSKPTKADWALIVSSRDLGEVDYELPYTDPLITTDLNLAVGATATASSQNGERYAPAFATDGDHMTYWCASSGNMPQWLQIDIGEIKAAKQVDIYMHKGNETQTTSLSYQLKGSKDGRNWDTLKDAVNVAPVSGGNSDCLRVLFDGEYRYYKIDYSKITTNWAAIYAFEVYADETEDTGSEVENFARTAVVTASSESTNSGPAKSADGTASTYWCASSGNMPQWLKYDFGDTKKIGLVNMYMYVGTSSISYKLEGSQNNVTWEEIKSENNAKTTLKLGLSFYSTEASGDYRYLRITFTNVVGNWATMQEFEVFGANETQVDDVLPKYDGKIVQNPIVKSVGTGVYTANGDYSNSAELLFDGDINTDWMPYAPIASQTILLDLKYSNTLSGIKITAGVGAMVPKYRIEGSNDGSNWTILADATLREPQIYTNRDRSIVCESLSGEYRFVKILWLGAPSNNSKKTISEIELFVLYADYTVVDAAISAIPSDLSIYTANTVAAVEKAVTAVVRNLYFDKQDTVDSYASAINAAIAALVPIEIEEFQLSISISSAMQEASNNDSMKYDAIWNATVCVNDASDENAYNAFNAANINIKEYGVFYGTSVSTVERWNELSSNPSLGMSLKKNVFDSGDDITMFTRYGFRLKNCAGTAVRAAAFYVIYEFDGKTITAISAVDAVNES